MKIKNTGQGIVHNLYLLLSCSTGHVLIFLVNLQKRSRGTDIKNTAQAKLPKQRSKRRKTTIIKEKTTKKKEEP